MSSCCCSVSKLCLALLRPHGLYNSPGFSVCGIFQVRILEWPVISFSVGSSWPRNGTRVSLMAGGFSTTEPLLLLLSQFSHVQLCDPIDSSPAGSPVPGILPARTVEWVAISFSNAWKWKVKLISRVRLFVTPWTIAHQAPLSMGFSRQVYWSGLPFPSLLSY